MARPNNNNFNKEIDPLEKNHTISYLDENDFVKKMRSLRTYCMRSYKDLIFNTDLKKTHTMKDGTYSINLYTSEEFKFVYGQIQLIYTVKNGHTVIENLLPQQILLDGYFNLLDVYKGVPYRNDKDKFKIDLFMFMKKGKCI